MTTPNPKTLFGNKQATPAIVADVTTEQSGKIVRPGLVDTTIVTAHDGVVKAKHLKPGQRVRPYVHGKPQGSWRVVDTIERLNDGADYRITWVTQHAPSTHKAAYRWYDDNLAGSPVTKVVQAPGLVEYEQV